MASWRVSTLALPEQREYSHSVFCPGYSLGASYNTIPALIASDLPADKVVTSWDNIFEIGKNFAIPMVVLVSPLYWFVAYKRWDSHYVTPLGISLGVDLTEGVQFAIAGTVLATIGPFTRFLMYPYSIKHMKHRVEVVNQAKAQGLEPILDHEAIWDDIADWTRHNTMRTVVFTTAFFLGLTAL